MRVARGLLAVWVTLGLWFGTAVADPEMDSGSAAGGAPSEAAPSMPASSAPAPALAAKKKVAHGARRRAHRSSSTSADRRATDKASDVLRAEQLERLKGKN